MNPKASIISAIQANKPISAPLPEIPSFQHGFNRLDEVFTVNATLTGSFVETLSATMNISHFVQSHFPDATRIVSSVPDYQGNSILPAQCEPKDLNDIDVAVIPSSLGVAENGAVWITEHDAVHRILPFITQHLIVVLSSQNLVENMHEAYRLIHIDATGFGVFIGGPSKTADIEQSLVVGAQGARSLSILLLT